MNIAMSISYGENSYYLRFSSEKTIYVNSDASADICIPGFDKKLEINWLGYEARIKVIDGKKSHDVTVKIDKLTELDEALHLSVYFTKEGLTPNVVKLPETCDLYIGRGSSSNDGTRNNIIIDLRFVSRKHFRLVRKNGSTTVCDLGSKNGLYLNGTRIKSAMMKDGDVLSIKTVRFIMTGDKLTIENAEGKVSIADIKEPDTRKAAPLSFGKQSTYKHSRSPRLSSKVLPEIISVEKPPQIGGPPKINWLNVLLSPMISVGLMLVLVFAMGMSPTMLIMSGVMSVVSAILAVTNYNSQKKQHSSQSGLIDEKYIQYLNGVSQKISSAKSRQLKALREDNPAPMECLTIASAHTPKLWCRTPADSDFVSVRLGEGTIKAAVSAKFQQSQVILEESPLEAKARELAQSSQEIKDAPIVCDLSSGRPVGVIGERAAELRLARNIITGLAASHSYDEVKIVAIIPQKEIQDWAWLRWLPHCSDDARERRYIFTNAGEAKEVLDEIDTELKFRAGEETDYHSNSLGPAIPHYIFVVAAPACIEKHAIYKHLMASGMLGVSTIFFYDKHAYLPKECEKIIEVSQDVGEIYEKLSSSQRTRFKLDSFALEEADRFSRSLASVYTETDSSNVSLPTGISFLEGYGVSTPEQLNIAQRWKSAQTFKTLSVPIAVLPGGERFYFDIHEKAHGVHGMVAGKTRIGKTEMVRSWLLSLSVNYSPQDVSFVLIDFKGTSLIAPFKYSPHLAGSISDLDVPKGIERNLAALKSEVHRRESLLAKYNVKTVNDLNKLYSQGHMPEKLPILIVVIDEFAEFKKTFPDFGAEIDSLTQRGGSLGMFTVLMAQNPDGVVSSQSEANISFRWCLKVASTKYSREMLGRPDAAKIRHAGRAYVKIGEEEMFEQVQSFYSGATYNPGTHEAKKAQAVISNVALNGEKSACEVVEMHESSQHKEAEIDVIIRHIAEYCRDSGVESARKIWTESLPERLAVHDLLNEGFTGKDWPDTEKTAPVVGLLDNPQCQQQYPLALDFSNCGHTVIYGAPSSGKTTLLQTMIISLAMSRRPDQVSIYIMDFGGWNLNILKDLPHIGGIANDNQPERIKKLVLLLQDILYERQAKFSKVGVGNISAYRDATGKQLPDIIFALDNFGPVLKVYPDLEDFFISVTSKGANYGIYMVVTATSTNNLPYKISQNFKNAIALEMMDKSDYTYTVGKINGKIPALPGRGYSKGNPPLEFQAALPAPGESDKEIADNVRRIIAAMLDNWEGEGPAVIPELPELIPYGSIKTKMPCLGLSVDRVMPVCYDLSSQHYLLISGTNGSGKSNMLAIIAKQIKDRFGGMLYVFDVNESTSPALKVQANVYLDASEEIDKFVESLMPEMKARQAAKKENSSVSFSPIILAIENYSNFFSGASNETVSRLLAIAKIGDGLGVYLLVADDSYELASMVNKGESLASFMSKGQQAVMLGGCINDHNAISTKMPYSQKNTSVKENEGFYVSNGETKLFKAMSGREETSL